LSPTREADTHDNRVDLGDDPLDDLRGELRLVLLEDLRERAAALVR